MSASICASASGEMPAATWPGCCAATVREPGDIIPRATINTNATSRTAFIRHLMECAKPAAWGKSARMGGRILPYAPTLPAGKIEGRFLLLRSARDAAAALARVLVEPTHHVELGSNVVRRLRARSVVLLIELQQLCRHSFDLERR